MSILKPQIVIPLLAFLLLNASSPAAALSPAGATWYGAPGGAGSTGNLISICTYVLCLYVVEILILFYGDVDRFDQAARVDTPTGLLRLRSRP